MSRLSCIAFVTLLFGLGCGNQAETTATGVVKYNGQPLVRGEVDFFYDDGTQASGPIGREGVYSIRPCKAGHAKIVIVSYQPPPSRKSGKAGIASDDSTKWFPIPDKYANKDTSGKEVTVKDGANKIDVDLD